MSFQASRWAWLQNAPLSATQKLVLLALADYANEAYTCWPTLATIAEKTRLSRRAVINALARLVDLNLVTRSHLAGNRNACRIGACGRSNAELR